jgi:shikimate kinase
MANSIVLVGPMGAGKTTIGRLLAQETGLPFKDVDHAVVDNAGANIPWIFDVEGEDGFRKREHQALAEILSLGDAIVATGGGIVTQEANCALLKKQPCVVFLSASVDQQFERTSKDKNRPLLQQENPRAVLEGLMAKRLSLYQEVSTYTADTDNAKPKWIVNKILEHWKNL